MLHTLNTAPLNVSYIPHVFFFVKLRGGVISTPHWYERSPGFKYRSSDRTSLLRLFTGVFSPSSQAFRPDIFTEVIYWRVQLPESGLQTGHLYWGYLLACSVPRVRPSDRTSLPRLFTGVFSPRVRSSDRTSLLRLFTGVFSSSSQTYFRIVTHIKCGAVQSVHKSSDSDSSIFKTPTPTPS
jgi:hypothetical protein